MAMVSAVQLAVRSIGRPLPPITETASERLRSDVSSQKPKSYRVVAVSLYADEAAMADRLADILRSGGWPKANRSLIIREGLARLEEDLLGQTPEGIFRYFVDRLARRAQAKSIRSGGSEATRPPGNRSDDQ
jgi:hypothetical protein